MEAYASVCTVVPAAFGVRTFGVFGREPVELIPDPEEPLETTCSRSSELPQADKKILNKSSIIRKAYL